MYPAGLPASSTQYTTQALMATGLVFMAAITGSMAQYLRPHPFQANCGYYRFDGFLSGSKYTEDFSLMVRSGDVVGTAMNTKLVFTDRSDSGPTTHPNAIVPRIYLGKLANYAPYSIDQTLLVVLPGRTVCEGNPICAFWQWTVDRHGSTKVNVDHTTSKMTNLEKVTDYVSFTDGSGYFTFHATVGLREFAEQQQLSLVITNRDPSFSTGSLVLELQDLRPSPSGRQPRGVNDNTTMVINDANKAPSGFQNAGPFLIRSPSPKIVELTNKPSEPAIRDRLDRDGMSAQLETKLQVAQLESQLRAEQDENKLLKTMLLEAERAREKDGLTAKDKVRGGAKWKCLIPSR